MTDLTTQITELTFNMKSILDVIEHTEILDIVSEENKNWIVDKAKWLYDSFIGFEKGTLPMINLLSDMNYFLGLYRGMALGCPLLEKFGEYTSIDTMLDELSDKTHYVHELIRKVVTNYY